MSSPRPHTLRSTISRAHCVLVVERDRDSGLAQMVRGLGYDVLQLEDPREALRLVRAQGGLVKLILADLCLPHMDAGELAERADVVQPGIHVVLLIRGLPGEAALLRAYPELTVLSKPVGFAPLYQLLRQVLGPPRQLRTPRAPSEPAQARGHRVSSS